MKKIFILASFLFFIAWVASCTSDGSIQSDSQSKNSSLTQRIVPEDKVGEIINGSYVITENISVLKDSINSAVKNLGVTQTIKDFSIQASGDTPGVYKLVGVSTDKSVKVGLDLVLDHNSFYVNFVYDSAKGVLAADTCVCTAGCTTGCDPEEYEKDGKKLWKCTSCVFGTGSGCTKTVTKTIKSLQISPF